MDHVNTHKIVLVLSKFRAGVLYCTTSDLFWGRLKLEMSNTAFCSTAIAQYDMVLSAEDTPDT